MDLKKFNENLYWILPVVKTIKKIYVDSALKKANKLNENAKESEYKGAQENISWKAWKKQSNNK
jgi:hypothetical protein